MADSWIIDRRQALGAGAATVVAGISAAGDAAEAKANSPNLAHGLAASFTIAARIPDPAHYIHDPGMAILPNGSIFVAAPVRRRQEAETDGGGPSPQSTSLQLARSDDRGKTWIALNPIPRFRDATPLVHRGALNLLIPHYAEKKMLVMRSKDFGETWLPPSAVVEGNYWNCQTSWARRDDRMYWAATDYPKGNSLVAVSADLSTDLMHPANWRISQPCQLPEIPSALKPAKREQEARAWRRPWDRDTWLEPNVINVNGQLCVLARVVVSNFVTVSLCGVCDLDDDGRDLRLSFRQFHPLPGGQCKFFIVEDGVSKLFWMLSNIPEDSQDVYNHRNELVDSGFVAGPGNDRRTLVLHYAVDGLNWFPAGVVARWPSPLQSFMYPAAGVDGDDLAFISRTSRQAPNQHDADLATFHRIKNFRGLASPITSRG